MEPEPPERAEVELLEPDPPGALERFATVFWQRRGARAATAVVVGAVVTVAAAVGLADEAPDSAAQAAADELPGPIQVPAPTSEEDWVPPPWVTSETTGWEVLGQPRTRHRSPVYVVTFSAVNRTGEARSPDQLRAVGRFVGDPGFGFSAPCAGFDHDEKGEMSPIRSMVEPGEKILVRCTDEMEYSGNRPRLVRRSLDLQEVPCESEGRGSPL